MSPRPGRTVLIGVARSGRRGWDETSGARRVHFYYEPDNIDADPSGLEPVGGDGLGPYPVIDAGSADGSA